MGIAVYGRITVAHVFLPQIETPALLRMACHMRLVRMLLVTVVPLTLALGGAWLYAWHWYAAPGPLTAKKTVLIAPGLGCRGIARVLAQEGVIGQPLLYMLRVLLAQQHTALQAGEYAFLPGIAPQEVTQKLTQGEVVLHSLTIPAGLVSDDIRAILTQEPLLTGALPNDLAEGAVLPETYFFRRGDRRAKVLARMQAQMQAVLDKAWQTRKPDVPLRTPQEALTLASIVEKETGLPQERGRVAAVFLNRLRRGMSYNPIRRRSTGSSAPAASARRASPSAIWPVIPRITRIAFLACRRGRSRIPARRPSRRCCTRLRLPSSISSPPARVIMSSRQRSTSISVMSPRTATPVTGPKTSATCLAQFLAVAHGGCRGLIYPVQG